MGAEDELLDGRGEAGRAVGGRAGGRLAGDGSPHHSVLQGCGGCAVATGEMPVGIVGRNKRDRSRCGSRGRSPSRRSVA